MTSVLLLETTQKNWVESVQIVFGEGSACWVATTINTLSLGCLSFIWYRQSKEEDR